MKERPILFSGAMVRAILADTKTQTRRVVKGEGSIAVVQQSNGPMVLHKYNGETHSGFRIECPYGQPGDRLWVRETWKPHCEGPIREEFPLGTCVKYAADGAMVKPTEWTHEQGAWCEMNEETPQWRPSIHMPRWASRITLEIVAVRVERLQNISEEDARAEGCDSGIWHQESGMLAGETDPEDIATFRDGYGFLWECINGAGSWALNPWVWVVEFRHIANPKS